jgi:hypothetical protein
MITLYEQTYDSLQSTTAQYLAIVLQTFLLIYHSLQITEFLYRLRLPNHIGGVVVSVLASSAVDRGFEPWSGQTKDYKIGSCCLSAKHAALRRKSKDWLTRNQKTVSEWSDMSIRRLLIQ